MDGVLMGMLEVQAGRLWEALGGTGRLPCSSPEQQQHGQTAAPSQLGTSPAGDPTTPLLPAPVLDTLRESEKALFSLL